MSEQSETAYASMVEGAERLKLLREVRKNFRDAYAEVNARLVKIWAGEVEDTEVLAWADTGLCVGEGVRDSEGWRARRYVILGWAGAVPAASVPVHCTIRNGRDEPAKPMKLSALLPGIVSRLGDNLRDIDAIFANDFPGAA